MWSETFTRYDTKYSKWRARGLQVERQPGRSENWAMVHKGSLFIGLNIVGGKYHAPSEWKQRLGSQADWTKGLIRKHRIPTVIFAHADPTPRHAEFFDPMTRFIRDELKNSIPILYLNGDLHYWQLNHNFNGQSNWMRIMVAGLGKERPLKVTVDPSQNTASSAFRYNR